jgi:3-hydroxyisobutyrate dehydrogenase-like beta-hydroxyacid dehydrogenase
MPAALSEPIGLIGVGLLGGAIAERLSAARLAWIGYDRDPLRLRQAAIAQIGGRRAASVVEVAAAARRIVLCLPTVEDSAAVLDEALPALSAGTIVADATTGLPAQAQTLAARLAARGVEYLDATVSGSSADVRAGQAVVVAGGRREAFEACADLFATFARAWLYAGPCGAGAAMKLVSNLVLGLNRAALAEGLSLAGGLGIDQTAALDLLRQGAAYSRAMDAKGRKMVDRDFAPQARLAQHLKDVRLMLQAAAEAGQPLPLSALHRELLERLVAAGHGAEDNSAILRAFDRPAK